jgi:hypothetical protein
MSFPPALVIDSLTIGDERVSAQLRIGPRRGVIEVGFYLKDPPRIDPYFISFEQMPKQLENIHRAQKAVIDVLERAHHGDVASVPLDLSDIVRSNEPEPWPLALKKQDRAAVPPIAVTVTQVVRDTPTRGLVTVHFQVEGVPAVAIVTVHDNRRQFRFVAGVHPWQLADAEAWVLLDALIQATPVGPPP